MKMEVICVKMYSDFVLLLHWKPKQVLRSAFPPWRFDTFLDVLVEGAKALGGQKPKQKKAQGRRKMEK